MRRRVATRPLITLAIAVSLVQSVRNTWESTSREPRAGLRPMRCRRCTTTARAGLSAGNAVRLAFLRPKKRQKKSKKSTLFPSAADLPTGLSVAAMFYVIEDGAQGTDGNQASTSDAIVLAGSSGSSCLGTNVGGDSQSTILSLASSLDPSFTYTR